MPWFERPLLALLRREYAAAMRFAEDDASAAMPRAGSAPCQLYVHVPFCETLCPFCSFHRVRFNGGKSARYFAALRREIALYQAAGFRFGDVYVGGGTPTVDAGELIATLDALARAHALRTVSVETNPDHLRPELLRQLADAGVTRLSVGVQSFDDGLLERMQRREKYGSGDEIAARLAAAQGLLPTLNVDMIFDLPGQSLAMLDADLERLLALGVDQISFYPLMTAPSARHAMQRTMGLPDVRLRHAMYERIVERLAPSYRLASAWCFSRAAGAHDEYIVEQEDYVGVGSGAFSYVGGTMYSTTFSLAHYLARVEGGASGITQHRALSTRERMRYDFLMRLFGGELKREDIARRWGRGFWLRLAPELAFMRALGATRHDADALRLTRRGQYIWVLMMAGFFDAVNGVRESMRAHVKAELEAWNEEARVPVEAIGGLRRV